MHRQYKERGVAVLAVDMEESKDKVAAWVRKSGVTFDVLLDPSGATSSAYQVTATPTVYLIGRDGKMLAKAIGTKAWMSAKGRALLDAMLK